MVARDHLGVGSSGPAPGPPPATTRRRRALIEDVRVLTGVLAMELATGLPAEDDRHDPAQRAALVHEATMRSESFALCAALTLVTLDKEAGRTPTGER